MLNLKCLLLILILKTIFGQTHLILLFVLFFEKKIEIFVITEIRKSR